MTNPRKCASLTTSLAFSLSSSFNCWQNPYRGTCCSRRGSSLCWTLSQAASGFGAGRSSGVFSRNLHSVLFLLQVLNPHLYFPLNRDLRYLLPFYISLYFRVFWLLLGELLSGLLFLVFNQKIKLFLLFPDGLLYHVLSPFVKSDVFPLITVAFLITVAVLRNHKI